MPGAKICLTTLVECKTQKSYGEMVSLYQFVDNQYAVL